MNFNEDIDARESKNDKAKEVMDLLEIPTIPVNAPNWYEIYAMDLYDILMDEEKLKTLISRLRNKAFW